jgi:hypothetical protein
MFFKKEKVEFYSTNVNSLYSFPIEPAHKIKFNWLDRMRQTLKYHKNYEHNHTSRCPGIFTPFKHGFVLKSWYDFRVVTNGDNTTMNIDYPSPDIFLDSQESITHHDPDWLVNFFDNTTIEGKKCHTKTVKIITSWHVHLPKGWQLLQAAIPYNEETRFTAATGIYDPLINNQITVPLFWNDLKSDTVVKAGTPLCYLLPVKLPEFDVEIREANKREIDWSVWNYRRNNTFLRDYNLMAKVSEKFFKK